MYCEEEDKTDEELDCSLKDIDESNEEEMDWTGAEVQDDDDQVQHSVVAEDYCAEQMRAEKGTHQALNHYSVM